MFSGLKAFWRGILHLNHRGYVYVWANVLWVFLSLFIITAPAAWAGLMKMSHHAYYHPSTDIHDFWDGFKENFKRGLVLTLLNFIIIGINIWNLAAYRESVGVGVIALRLVWLSVLWVWFTVQLYMWALFYEMETPTLWGAMRNALVMLVLNPFFTLGLWLGLILLLIFSTVLPVSWLLLTGGALAAIANSAVRDRLQNAGYKKDHLSENALTL
jgi:uncharacterized membrane protein YesL